MSPELISQQASAASTERLRQHVRKLLPRSLYGHGSRAIDSYYAVSALGFSQWREVRRKLSSTNRLVEVKVRNFPHPVFVRPRTTDFAELIYTSARGSYGAYAPEGEVRTILDAGGYIGDTAVWYLNRYPKARVISLEPSSENFELLKKNTAPYGDRITVINAALWSRSTGLRITGTSHDGFSVKECESDADCSALSMRDLLETYAPEGFDIFKCDIEGAELQVFSSNPESWVQQIRFAVVEIHSENCLRAVTTAFAQHDYHSAVHRNLHFFFTRSSFLPAN